MRQADGALLWEQHYNGTASGHDIAQALAVDGSANVVVTGYSWNGSNLDYYTAKYAAADGSLLSEKRYNGTANSEDVAWAVAVDASGNVVVTGYSDNGAPHYNLDYYTAKYAAKDGSLLWEQRYNGPANTYDEAIAVAVDGDGNAVVTGFSYGSTNNPDYYTAKYAAADGALLWEQRYNGTGNGADFPVALALDASGNVVVTGRSVGTGSTNDYYTVKYAVDDGAVLWERRYDGPANNADVATAVAIDADGNVVVTGDSNNGINSDYYTAKYAAADGAVLWARRDNATVNRYDMAFAVAVDGSGNVVVTGNSYSGDKYDGTDYYTAKHRAVDGALLWEKRYNGPANLDDYVSALAVDGSGNVVVTGSSYGRGTSLDYYTAKYAATDGALLWERRYNGPANSSDEAEALAVDGSGNVVVTGSSINGAPNYSYDYYTAKYAASDGALLWEKRYSGPTNGNNQATAVAVDGDANVIVTGSSDGIGGSTDYYTAKDAAADGSLLWEKRYNGPANGTDKAYAVAVDSSGNVVVTGESLGIGSSADYYTAKYATADGALLWEKRYNGPANNEDVARSVAIDGDGNVAVTGYSCRDCLPLSFDQDYYTAKYAAADGALI